MEAMLHTPEEETEELSRGLSGLAVCPERPGDGHWAAWVRRDANLVSRGDAYGLTHFLSAFGGMGSLGDALFDGTGAGPLASRCYELAAKLKREANALGVERISTGR